MTSSSRFLAFSSHFLDECWKHARPRLRTKPHDDNFFSQPVCCGPLCLVPLGFHLRRVSPWPSVSIAATGVRAAGGAHAARASTRFPVAGGSFAARWLLPCWPSSPQSFSPPRSSRNGAYSGKSRAQRASALRGEDQAQEFRLDQRSFRSTPRPEANKARSSRRPRSYSDSQFSSFRPGTRPNSRVLAVINRAPTESECPAMSVS